MTKFTPPQERYLRDRAAFPGWLIIESTNRCNANCAICPHGDMTRPAGTMTMELFRKIADEASAHRDKLEKFALFLHGEPLLDDLLPERISYAKRLNIPHIYISTNGMLLDAERGRLLVEAGLDELVISIDGATAAGYNASKRGLNFRQVEENAGRFIANRGPVAVTVRMIEFPGNAVEAEAFRARWSGCGAAVVVERAHNWGGARAGLRPGGVPAEQFPCHTPWASMVILHDGTVPLCCLDYDAKYRLGDLKTQSIVEIWRGAELARLRDAHLDRDYRAYPLCANCSYTFDQPQPDWWFPARPAKK